MNTIVLPQQELMERATTIRMLLTDCDGVLTDTGVYYSERGEELKRFSVRDGMGVACLRAAGIHTGILTGEFSPPLVRRAEKLGITRLYQGIRNKKAHLETILRECGLGLEHIAYIGDDINDLGIIETVRSSGLTAAPCDALPLVAQAVHFRCSIGGGHGAFRELADWLLTLRVGHTTQLTDHSSHTLGDDPASSQLHHIHGGQLAQATRARR